MRRLLLILVWCIPPALGASPTLHKTLDIELDPAAGSLEAEAEITYPGKGAIVFRLDEAFEMEAVRLNERPVEPRGENGRWRIDTEGPGPQHLSIRYHGEPGDVSARQGQPPFIGQEGVFLHPAGEWYPVFEVSTFGHETNVRLPRPYRVVVSGNLAFEREEGEHHIARYTMEEGAADITLVAGHWHQADALVAGVRVRTLFEPALSSQHADTYLKRTVDYLRHYTDRIGEFPFNHFAIASSPLPVGLAFPGFTLLGERVIPLPFIPETSLAHELVHSWWGNGVYVRRPGGNWSEALTTYMADYALEAQRGEDREMRAQWLRDYAALPDAEDYPLSAFRGGNRGAARIIGYHKGAMVFYMLERQLGSEVFNAGIRRFYEENRFQRAGWQELEDAFSAAAELPLNWFFEQWIERSGAPRLEVEGFRREEADDGWRIRGRLLQSEPPWRLLIPVVAELADGTEERMHVGLEKAETAVDMRVAKRPVAVHVDPDYQVFRELLPPEAPAILRIHSLSPEAVFRVLEPGEAWAEAGTRLANGLLHPEASREESETVLLADGDRPLLLMASTETALEWLAAEDHTAILEKAAAGDARVLTLPETRIAIASADTPAALGQLARTVRHYTARSYVIMEDGEAIERGVWPAPGAPLTMQFE